jgi:type IV fimbrial biogenesis protein FimT
MRSTAGFTLVEFAVTIAVMMILLGAAVPGFRRMVQNQRMTLAVNDLFSSMNLARSEAIRRGVRVDLVPADGRDWASGWVVFIDGNGNQQADAGERVVLRHDALPPGFGVKAALTDSAPPYLAYDGSGRTRTNGSSQRTQFGTFTLTLDGQVRKIKLNFVGRPRICNPATERSTC